MGNTNLRLGLPTLRATLARALTLLLPTIWCIGCAAGGGGTAVYHGSTRAGTGSGNGMYAPSAAPATSPRYADDRGSNASVTSDESLSTRMKELAKQVADSLGREVGRPRVAVYDFITIKGETSEIGPNVAEELMMGLLATGRVTVVERTVLKKALDELNFNATDAVDPDNSRQIGRMVGADVIATGTLTDYNQKVKVNARLIETETGTVLGFGSVSVKRAAFGGAAPEPAAPVVDNGNGSGNGTTWPQPKPGPGSPPDDSWMKHGSDPPYIGGAASPQQAWAEFIVGIATGDVNRAANVVRPNERYMLQDPNALSIAYAFALTNPTLGEVDYDGNTAYAWYSWMHGTDEVSFVRINGYWFIVLNE